MRLLPETINRQLNKKLNAEKRAQWKRSVE